MRYKNIAVLLGVFVLGALAAAADTLRVVVVETSDVAAYAKAVEQGQALLKSKGSPAVIRVWRGRFAGENAGSVIASIEYPNLEALAKDDARMSSDAELRAWLQSLDGIRKVVSDSIYEQVKP